MKTKHNNIVTICVIRFSKIFFRGGPLTYIAVSNSRICHTVNDNGRRVHAHTHARAHTYTWYAVFFAYEDEEAAGLYSKYI